MPQSQTILSDSMYLACLFCILSIPFTWAGLALINTGLNRTRSAAHAILSTLSAASVAMMMYFIFGFAVQGIQGTASHVATIAHKTWDMFGAGPIALHGFYFDSSTAPLTFLFLLFSVALSSIIPISTGSERWTLGAMLASTAIFSSFTFPLFAHWVWTEGWLAHLGDNFGLGHGFIDAGGSSCIQVVGGLTALSVAWILGPRQGKFTSDGFPSAMPGHDSIVVVFGCILALIGWLGLNSSGAILFANIQLAQIVLICANTTLCATSSGITVLLLTRLRFGRPDASLTANGFIGGLVASSASVPFIQPWAAVAIGLIAGTIVLYAIEIIELHLQIDDPAAAISVHGMGGIWGILALGIFAHHASGTMTALHSTGFYNYSHTGQFLAQGIGVASLIGCMFPITYGINWVLNRFIPQRVTREGERQGLDLYELGSGAYPEFAIHHDDFSHL